MGRRTTSADPKKSSTQTLGEMIREARIAKGLSLRELASRTGISLGFVSHLELDRRSPSDPVLQRISAALDVPAKTLQARNPLTALLDFKKLVEKDRDLNVSFVSLVRDVKRGKLTVEELKRLLATS